MKSFIALIVVVVVGIGAGIQFLVSPVMTAYGICEDARNEKLSALMTPAAREEKEDYCTASREALDDMVDCTEGVLETNSAAPYIVSYKVESTEYQAMISNHTQFCPEYKLGLE